MPASPRKIPYVNLGAQWQDDRDDLLPIIDTVLGSGQYVGGDELDKFEKNMAELCQVKYAVALNSGTDALTFSLHLLGVGRGDEVITAPNSFIASAAVIIHLGAKPVFVDVQPDQNIDPGKIEVAITEKTKAIMPVHLTGRVCDMDPIIEIAEKFNLKVIEDAAQAIGSKYRGKSSGSIGHVGCFSTHPLKNLNACGDGGFMTTDNEKIYLKAKALRNHGMTDRNNINYFGYVSRMDNLQAAILNYRLSKFEGIIEKRRNNARLYFANIQNESVYLPIDKKYEFNTWHTFVIQTEKRNQLQKYLSEIGIDTAVHYPVPIHLQPASKKLGYRYGDFPIVEKQAKSILTLPINQYLKSDEVKFISDKIDKFFKAIS
jgi:dTDP-4-amino-4,6-dideoxygalactose transaminase